MMACHRNRLPRRTWGANVSGINLIELLVVVTIIGLLVILLFPSLQRIREQAAAAGCSSNLRQLAAAMLAYAGEHNGYLPESKFKLTPRVEDFWMHRIVADGHLSGPVICPQFSRGNILPTSYSPVLCTYAANQMLTGYNRNDEQVFEGTKLGNIPKPASTILVAESRFEFVASSGKYYTYPSIVVGDGEFIGKVYDRDSGRRGPAIRYTHGGHPLAAFADGHVEARAAPWPDEAFDPNNGE